MPFVVAKTFFITLCKKDTCADKSLDNLHSIPTDPAELITKFIEAF